LVRKCYDFQSFWYEVNTGSSAIAKAGNSGRKTGILAGRPTHGIILPKKNPLTLHFRISPVQE